MPIIFITIIIMYAILLAWSFHSLVNMEIPKKILVIAVILIITYIFTYITYTISKQAINYQNEEIMSYVKNVLLLIFTGINGFITMPFLCKQIEGYYQENITQSDLAKKILITLIVLIVLLVLECGYMTNTQQGIIGIINNKS